MQWSAYIVAVMLALGALIAAFFISLLMRQLHSPLMYGNVLILAAGIIALLWSLRRRHYRTVFAALATTQLLVWLFFLGQSLPQFDYDPGAYFAEAIQRHSTAVDRVGSMRIEPKALLSTDYLAMKLRALRKVERYAVLAWHGEGGRLASDHFPVVADLRACGK